MVIDKLVVQLEADTSRLDQDVSQAKSKFSGFKSVVTGMAMGAGMAVANFAMQAGASLLEFGADSVSAASDLGETMSKVGVVFGTSSDQVKAWSENAATALGQSQQQALDAAGTFGNLFVSMGMADDTSADMSMSLVELASDLASFNNMDPTETLEKLRAGMLGSAEPMQSLGVNMTAASVEAKALEMGLAATTDALTPAMLAQARYALILDQTKTAQGDFARTSEGLANQQRIVDAQWQDMQATVGEALLPVMLAFTKGMNDILRAVLPPLSAFIKDQVIPAMTSLSESIGWITSIIMPPLVAFINTAVLPAFNALATIVGWVTGLFRGQGGELPGIVERTWGWIQTYIQTVTANVQDTLKVFTQLLQGDFRGAGETLRGIFQRTFGFVRDTIEGMISATREAITGVDWGALGKAIIDGIAEGIRNAPDGFRDALGSVIDNGMSFAQGLLGIQSPSKVAAKEIGEPFAAGIGVGMQDAMSGVQDRMGLALDGLMEYLSGGAPATAGGPPISLVQNFYGPADAPAVRGASRDGVLNALRAAGAR